MAEHKPATQVTLSTGGGEGELHGLVRQYWKPAVLLVGVAAAFLLWRVAAAERRVRAVHDAWNRVRKDVQFQYSVEPAPTAVLVGLEEEIAGTSAAPWVRAISVGSQLTEGKSSQALEAAKSIAASWPESVLSKVSVFPGESSEARMTLPAWIESASAALASFEAKRNDLVANPIPSEAAPRVRIHTSGGDVVVALFDDLAPKHAENFLKLCREGFYDGTKIHRLVPGQYLEGGDPNSRTEDTSSWGMGNPGYSIPHESGGAWHYKYSLTSVQSSDNYSSNGGQFRILLSDAHSLDGVSSVFGVVVEGQDVLDKLGAAPVTGDRPTETISIDSAEVVKPG